MSDYETVLYEVQGSKATITLNRPDNLNGITNRMMRELYECVCEAAEDRDVRVVKVTGAGRGFCPGADLKAYSSGEPQEANRRAYFQITSILHEMPKVTVAAINGACAGAGFGWAGVYDIRYAAARVALTGRLLASPFGEMTGP